MSPYPFEASIIFRAIIFIDIFLDHYSRLLFNGYSRKIILLFRLQSLISLFTNIFNLLNNLLFSSILPGFSNPSLLLIRLYLSQLLDFHILIFFYHGLSQLLSMLYILIMKTNGSRLNSLPFIRASEVFMRIILIFLWFVLFFGPLFGR